MRVVLQRVSEAAVHISDECVGEIAHGFLLLLGIETEDDTSDADYLIQKVSQMRVLKNSLIVLKRFNQRRDRCY